MGGGFTKEGKGVPDRGGGVKRTKKNLLDMGGSNGERSYRVLTHMKASRTELRFIVPGLWFQWQGFGEWEECVSVTGQKAPGKSSVLHCQWSASKEAVGFANCSCLISDSQPLLRSNENFFTFYFKYPMTLI